MEFMINSHRYHHKKIRSQSLIVDEYKKHLYTEILGTKNVYCILSDHGNLHKNQWIILDKGQT